MLLFCDFALKDFIKHVGLSFIDTDEGIDTKALKSLETRETDSLFKLVLTTCESAMRGVDYRAKGVPIALIVAKSFSNKRELIQGLCRVGRFGDACERYMLKGVQLYDSQVAQSQAKALFKYLDRIAPTLKAKQV